MARYDLDSAVRLLEQCRELLDESRITCGDGLTLRLHHRFNIDWINNLFEDINDFLSDDNDIDCICYEDDDDEWCHECNQPGYDCECDDDNDEWCYECNEWYNDCICDDNDCDEFDKEFIADTFRPMSAFARARWLKLQGKL